MAITKKPTFARDNVVDFGLAGWAIVVFPSKLLLRLLEEGKLAST